MGITTRCRYSASTHYDGGLLAYKTLTLTLLVVLCCVSASQAVDEKAVTCADVGARGGQPSETDYVLVSADSKASGAARGMGVKGT